MPPVSTAASPTRPIVLFTAFEPSGDAHAAPVIRALKRLSPDVEIYAWGGPKMEQAGATIVEKSVDDAAMGLGAIGKARAVKKQITRIKRWAKQARVVVHVPVDSPASNFPICRILRKQGARTVHLVAPQIWAWGGWRIGKLRRRTDGILCLLPFEEKWFNDRGVPATFIGHPAINRALDEQELHRQAGMLPQAAPRLAIFPGSRTHEVKKNVGLLFAAFRDLKTRHADLCGLVVAARPALGQIMRKKFAVLPTGLHIVNIDPDVAVHWCDFALTVSGTMSLDIARQHKPMVGVYRVGWFAKALSLVMLRTKHRLLPNIIAGRRIVPEFVPYAGGPGRIVKAVSPFLEDTALGAKQRADLKQMLAAFADKRPAEEGAALILRVLRGQPFRAEK